MTTPVAPDLPGLTPVRHLGSGGYADVFLYDQHQPKRRVAVKVLKDAQLADRKHVQRFVSEANAMAELEHPHIVPVYSTGVTADGRPFIVMMYYPNANLADRAAVERFGVDETLRIGIQIGSAVETAHRANLLHRDIKPANILVNQWGQPGLTDFGIAAQMAEADDDDAGLSLPWAPPEVVYGTAPARASSDTYSLAATLWHLLVGRSPFEAASGNSSYELMTRIRDLPAPSTGLAIPPSFDRLLRQAMAKNPDQRPRRALDFVMALQSVEQELRLPRTEAIVESPRVIAPVQADTTRAPIDSTRLKGPALVPPRPAPAPPPVLSRPPVDEPERTRVRHTVDPEAVPEATARRDGSAPPIRRDDRAEATIQRARTVDIDVPEGEGRRTRRPALIALGVTLLVVAVVIGVVLSRAGRGQSATTASTPATTANVGNEADLLPPGPVTIKGTRKDSVVTFTWAYSAALSNDSFRWRTADGKSTGVAKSPTVDINSPVGTPVCLQVKVVRADGSNAAPDWSPQGCVP